MKVFLQNEHLRLDFDIIKTSIFHDFTNINNYHIFNLRITSSTILKKFVQNTHLAITNLRQQATNNQLLQIHSKGYKLKQLLQNKMISTPINFQ